MDDLERARLLAVEVLLADPEALHNDALETDLYILRDQLQPEPSSNVTDRSTPVAAQPQTLEQ
jgi:hypothetical protein